MGELTKEEDAPVYKLIAEKAESVTKPEIIVKETTNV